MKTFPHFTLYLFLTVQVQVSVKAEAPHLLVPPESEKYYQAPTHVPEWLKGHENLLPPVDSAVVMEMPRLLIYWSMTAGEGGLQFYAPEYKPEAMKALRRITELKEQASNALLWLYTFEQGDITTLGDSSKGRIIQMIAHDPALTEQMLPLLRQQVAWLTEKFRSKPINEDLIAPFIGQVIGYLLTWGDEKDVEALAQMIKLLQENGQNSYGGRQYAKQWNDELNGEFEGPLAHRARKERNTFPQPYGNIWLLVGIIKETLGYPTQRKLLQRPLHR